MTADPNNSTTSTPSGIASCLLPPVHRTRPPERTRSRYRGPTLFARTTNGGASWEDARIIYDPGTLNQTIGNQIVVLPTTATLVDLFALIYGTKNAHKNRGINVALIRSKDKGATWSQKPIIFAKLLSIGSPTRRTATWSAPPISSPKSRSTRLAASFTRSGRTPASAAASTTASRSPHRTDGGLTWSTPVKVNKTPTNIPAGQPAGIHRPRWTSPATDGLRHLLRLPQQHRATRTSCQPITGRSIAIRLLTGGCSDAGDYGDEIRLTDSPFDMENAPVARGYFLGDYEGLANAGRNFGAFFSKTEGTDNSASIYFRRYVPQD